MRPLDNIGDLQATVDGNQCPQLNDDGAVVGNEDCLYLNVYAPQTTTPQQFPTMIYIHGGGFVRGSGSSTNAGPEYLLDRDIVLVTVNYRLGVLGFLSTGDAVAPGNFGLKDLAVALQWIRQHIQFFGGVEPMTIFGQGAGGASAGLLAISPMSRGLFDQYISQSGHALSYWAAVSDKFRNYKQRGRNLGAKLNCRTYDSAILVDCLRNTDVQSLVDSNDIFENGFSLDTWAPTVEKRDVEGAFLTDYPLHVMFSRIGIKDCPSIIGNVHDEGLIFTAELYANDTLYDTIVSDLRAFIKPIVELFFTSKEGQRMDAVEYFQNFFFDVTPPIDKELFIQNMTRFITDIGFRRQTEFLAKMMDYLVTAPMYFYNFDYHGTYSKTSATIGNNDDIGVTHGDDLIYFFPIKNVDFKPSESDEKMIDIMLDFWTSFAYTGTPTSPRLADPNVWPRYDYETMPTLKIGKNSDPMDMQTYIEYDKAIALWDELLSSALSDSLFVEFG